MSDKITQVSIIVIAHNEEAHINKCLSAILNQSFAAFELIVIDDGSTDKTGSIVKSIPDARISYIRNDKNCGLAGSRNIGLRNASGKYVFFTEADCVPVKYWLEEGLAILKTKRCAGVSGKTLPSTVGGTISDRITVSLSYGINNIAYTKEILDRVGGFDLKYNLGGEGLDLAFRVKEHGEIIFSEDMIVVQQKKKYTIKSLFRDIKREQAAVYLIKDYKKYRDTNIVWHRILYPKKLLVLFCPWLLIFFHNLRSWQDIIFLPFVYISFMYLRFVIWKTALKEKIILI